MKKSQTFLSNVQTFKISINIVEEFCPTRTFVYLK